MFSPGQCAQLACILEATARKPGNITRYLDFDDLTYLDLVLSAAAIAPVMDRAAELGVGRTVLDSLQATRRFVGGNSNLGMLLMLAPLAAVSEVEDLQTGVAGVLQRLSIEDARQVFAAIRLGNPGGLGEAREQDVRSEPTLPLRAAMAQAADRDLIARQYANGFREVFDIGVPPLTNVPLESAIIRCHLQLLAALGDSHIARRCGQELSDEARRRAEQVLALGWPETLAGRDALEAFDAWLRADGHRRNPGSSADLVAASLFVALRRGMINFPLRF